MNYWAQTDGVIADFDDDARGSSEVIQDVPGRRAVGEIAEPHWLSRA